MLDFPWDVPMLVLSEAKRCVTEVKAIHLSPMLKGRMKRSPCHFCGICGVRQQALSSTVLAYCCSSFGNAIVGVFTKGRPVKTHQFLKRKQVKRNKSVTSFFVCTQREGLDRKCTSQKGSCIEGFIPNWWHNLGRFWKLQERTLDKEIGECCQVLGKLCLDLVSSLSLLSASCLSYGEQPPLPHLPSIMFCLITAQKQQSQGLWYETMCKINNSSL